MTPNKIYFRDLSIPCKIGIAVGLVAGSIFVLDLIFTLLYAILG